MRLESYSDKVIVVTEKYLNSMLLKISKSYTNLFLFDDNERLPINDLSEKDNHRLSAVFFYAQNER